MKKLSRILVTVIATIILAATTIAASAYAMANKSDNTSASEAQALAVISQLL